MSEEACSTVVRLRKVDISHPTEHYTYAKKLSGPLEKILGPPLVVRLRRVYPKLHAAVTLLCRLTITQ